MQMIENKQYRSLVQRLLEGFPHWDKLNGKTIFLSGASGMIGSLLVDAIMLCNETCSKDRQCKVIALGRNQARAEARFANWLGNGTFFFIAHDISEPLPALPLEPDFFIHAASTTHPVAYATEPVNTIVSNVLGTRTLLDLAAQKPGSRFLLLSSVEIYGENRGDTEYFDENYCGYLNCNTLRAGYPEAKRVSESLCQAYMAQRGVETVILRLPRCYGPTMQPNDSKAIAQFIKNGVRRENIVLKSKGEQLYSFAHVSDAVSGMLWVLLCGEPGQAYNLGDERSNLQQKDLAKLIADYTGTKVVFELPDEVERKGYSTASKALLDSTKLQALGWRAKYDIANGIQETIDILRQK